MVENRLCSTKNRILKTSSQTNGCLLGAAQPGDESRGPGASRVISAFARYYVSSDSERG